jgi:hypothetical protein
MVKAEEVAGEPPLDRSPERGASAPAVRVARALVVARVVDSLEKRSPHAESVAHE